MLLDGYVRVSRVRNREGERFVSPGVQRQQIVSWAEAHGAELGQVFEELNESGARSDRPQLIEAIERVERGESGGVVVAKLDRFGRSVLDGLRAIQRIEQAGGTFVSVQDGFDLGTSTGRLILQVLLSIGEWELDGMRSSWEVARERATSRGVYIGGAPIGYRKRADGRLRIDRQEAVLIREIFRRRADGESFLEIARSLNAKGAKTRRGLPFAFSSIYQILRNPVYRGEAHHGVYRKAGAHEAIIDRALWQLCQYGPRPRNLRYQSLLSGMIRCASCGRMMSTYPFPESDWRYHAYICGDAQGICSAPAYVRGDELDPLVEEFIFNHCRQPEADAERRIRECESELEAADKDLVSYRDEPAILTALGASAFAEGLAARQLQLEKSLVNLATARRAFAPPLDLAALAEEWPELEWTDRRRAVGKLIDCVIVERGRTPATERVWVYRPGKAAIRRVAGRVVISSKSIPKNGERLPSHQQWSPARLEKELREFLRGRSVWPAYREFAEAGRARLFAQVLDYGGPVYWGHRFGVGVPTSRLLWNKDRVRAALRPFLEGRVKWPGAREFGEAGMRRVYNAAKYHGGLRYWAEEFGYSYGNGRVLTWPEERIAYELGQFTADRRDFPSRAEFHQAGLQKLYVAIYSRGGTAYWAERLELVRLRGAGTRGRGGRRRPEDDAS